MQVQYQSRVFTAMHPITDFERQHNRTRAIGADRERAIAGLNVPVHAMLMLGSRYGWGVAKTFLSLKMLYGGQVRRAHLCLSSVAVLAGYTSERTFRNHLKRLMGAGIIATDGEWVFIRGFEYLRRLMGAKERVSCKMGVHDVPILQSVMLGGWIHSKNRTDHWIARVRGRAKQHPKRSVVVPLRASARSQWVGRASCSLIAQSIGRSKATACRVKQRAVRAGVLVNEGSCAPVVDAMGQPVHLSTLMDWEHWKRYASPSSPERFFIVPSPDGFAVHERKANFVRSATDRRGNAVVELKRRCSIGKK